MASGGESRDSPSKSLSSTAGERWDRALIGTLPLIGLTAALLIMSDVFYAYEPHAGPAHFPLWGLLLTLGLVAGVGASVSWFFATDDQPPESRSPAKTGRARASVKAERVDFGRPTPEVAAHPGPVVGVPQPASTTASEPWNEDVLPPATAHGPRPVWTTPDDPGEIAQALEEIAEIQRQLTTRPRSRPASVAEPLARA